MTTQVSMTRPCPPRLSDEQIRHFITDGLLFFAHPAPAAFHAALVAELTTLWQTQGDPGHALIPRVTRAQAIIGAPVIRGALASLLGPDYLVDPCRHVHLNTHAAPGGWHQDDYCAVSFPHDQNPWILMLCYFPQDTPSEMGPTGLLPGSQYTQATPVDDAGERVASGPAGTCVLLRGDLWHRATANTTGRQRYMLKFLFTRQAAPREPHWVCHDRGWRRPWELAPTVAPQEATWRAVWAWLCGTSGQEGTP